MNKRYEIESTFLRVFNRCPAFLRRPTEASGCNDIAVVLMHSDSDYLDIEPGIELAKNGFTTLAVNPPTGLMETKLQALGACVSLLRDLPHVEKVILFGHSGGASLISAYQAIAENGGDIFRGPEMLYKLPDIGDLPAADGVMIVDSNWGNGTMTLVSLDPCITDEGSGLGLDLSYNMFDPANGYSSDGSHYTDEFALKFQTAQGERMNRLIEKAVERLHIIESGKGLFSDDEPFLIPGGSQAGMNNKMFPQDIRFLSHTNDEHLLLHGDGTATTGIVRSLRLPAASSFNCGTMRAVGMPRSVKAFLSNSCVWTNGFHYDETNMYGIDFSRSFCNTPGNIRHVHAPVVFVGLTGGYESMAAEMLYNTCQSSDKSIAYVEGATHNFTPNLAVEKFPGQFGDTVKTLCDYLSDWMLSARFGK